jgi:chorismate dehydratase
VYDLAEEWRSHTGLPFVFAFWAVRSDSVDRLSATGVDFAAAKLEGVERIGDIARDYAVRLGLPVQELESYLTDNISYDLDPESLRGLNLYYELAHRCGLIDAVPELAFL